MPDTTNCTASADTGGMFKEAVCIDAGRVYDSCSDKDCLEDLKVYFNDETQSLINTANTIKVRSAQVLFVQAEVEPVPFNKGFYSVDMTFYFNINVDIFTAPAPQSPTNANGLALFSKKVILYGSDGSVRNFSSDSSLLTDSVCITLDNNSMPTANIKVVDPIVLSTKFCECSDGCIIDIAATVPQNILCFYGGTFGEVTPTRFLYLTLGMFSIVQIKREVQMMIPTFDFCMPDKECITNTEDPCELFSRIRFPSNEFFPPKLNDIDEGCGCKE